MSNWFRVGILLYQYNILNILQVQSCSRQERIDEGRTYYMYHLFLQWEQLKIYYLTNFQEKIHFLTQSMKSVRTLDSVIFSFVLGVYVMCKLRVPHFIWKKYITCSDLRFVILQGAFHPKSHSFRKKKSQNP